jgi:cytochrome oxidase Cu insertion factor (SCO1/SenC/PrrC family)
MQSNSALKMKSNRRILLILLLLFVFPAIVSITMYATGWRPSATVNHGELILPVRPVADREMKAMDGKPVKISELHGKWTMVYFDSSSCSEACMSQLYFMRQIHIAQGKNYDRIQRVFMLTDAASVDSLNAKLTEYPDMLVLGGDQSVMAGMYQDFGLDIQSAGQKNSIFLLDPQGNLMMKYKFGAEPAGIRKDIERLLKYSSEK